MSWRLAKSLETLRSQINAAYPKRSKVSDGTIGDPAHAGTVSDHNPNSAGVVTAFDVTNDPKNGPNLQTLADKIKTDSRVKYLIFNHRIFEPSRGWYAYNGSNPHTSHLHISVGGAYDSTKKWSIIETVDNKITSQQQIILYRFYLGSGVTPTGKKNIGKKTFAEEQARLIKSTTFKNQVAAAKAGKLDASDHLPSAVRAVYQAPNPSNPVAKTLAPGLYKVT